MFRNSLTLLSASSLSQLIGIVVYPLVTRLYSPSDLGAMSLFLSIGGILSIIASGKFESAILTEKEDADAAAVFDLSFLLNLLVSVVLFVLLLIVREDIVRVFKIEPILEFILWIPFWIFVTTLGSVYTFWFNRKGRFGLNARYNIVQSIANSGSKVGFGSLSYTKWGLIIASCIGPVAGLVSVMRAGIVWDSLYRLDFKRMKRVCIHNIDLFKYTLPHSLMNTIAGNLPVLILSAWFNMTEVGLFSLGITLGFRPISLFTNSVNQVLFQRVSDNHHQGNNSYQFLMQYTKKVFYIGLPIFALTAIIIKPVIGLLFGTAWLGAADYVLMTLPMLLVMLVSSSVCFMSVVAKKQKEAMVFEMVYIFLRIIALFIGVWLNSVHLAVLLYSIVSTVYLLVLTNWYLRLAKNLD